MADRFTSNRAVARAMAVGESSIRRWRAYSDCPLNLRPMPWSMADVQAAKQWAIDTLQENRAAEDPYPPDVSPAGLQNQREVLAQLNSVTDRILKGK